MEPRSTFHQMEPMEPMEVSAPDQILMNSAVGGSSAAFIKAKKILSQQDALKVQQIRRKRDMCSLDFNNWYLVKDGNTGKDLFFVQENSTCMERNCCSGECKAWRMEASLLPNGWQGPESAGAPFLHLERPFSLTCCCINRPKVIATEVPSGVNVGTLTDPFACCKLNTTVQDPESLKPVYSVDGSICQPSLFCPFPGMKVDFPVKEVAVTQWSGQTVARLHKVWTLGDCCPCCSKEWSSFDVDFGDVRNPGFKLLLMSTAIFVQMAFFDKRAQ